MSDEFTCWTAELGLLLVALRGIDIGYPQGTNEILSATRPLPDLPDALVPLYQASDGVSLPDVHVGYFIDTAQRVAGAAARGEPTRLTGSGSSMTIHVFGSDGGGGRFALGAHDGAVYHLPSLGAVKDGAFIQDDASAARKLSGSLLEFLHRLGADIAAFVQGEPDGYRYLVD